MAAPRCPHCNAGIGKLAHQPVGFYAVVYCGQCGAIHGVIPAPKPQPEPAKPEQTPAEPPPVSAAPAFKKSSVIMLTLYDSSLDNKRPYSAAEVSQRMRMAGVNMGNTAYRRVVIDDGPPLCPTHRDKMICITVPPGYKNSGRKLWVCSAFSCDKWELAE